MDFMYVVYIDGKDGRQWVSSPTSTLTDNPHRCAVIDVEHIDDVYAYWDRKSNGKANMLTYNEYKVVLWKFDKEWKSKKSGSMARAGRIAASELERIAKSMEDRYMVYYHPKDRRGNIDYEETESCWVYASSPKDAMTQAKSENWDIGEIIEVRKR